MREKVPSCDTEPLLRRHSSPPFAAISLSAGSATHVQLQSENPEWKTVEMDSLFYLSTAQSNTVSRPLLCAAQDADPSFVWRIYAA